MNGTLTRHDAARLIELLATSLAVQTERVDIDVAESGNVFIDGHLAATIREA